MTVLFIVGRIVFGLYWLNSAYNHIFKSAGLVGYTQMKTGYTPGKAKAAVIASGILLAIGGLTLIAGVWVRLGILCLSIFLVGASFKMHPYWKAIDANSKMADHINFWKNVALLAALFMILSIPLPYWSW